MAKASDNVFPKLIFSSGAAPATPSAGQGKVYEKSSDKKLYFKNEDGTEYDLTASGSSGVATDVIYDAKGDIPIGTGADAASKLAVGSNGQILTADSTQATGVKWAAASGGGFGAYASYTPALTATTTNPTLGTGSTATGRWTQDNKTVHVQINITFGSSGVNAGSGQYRISLPVTAAAGPDCFGSGFLYDSSSGLPQAAATGRVTTTTFQIFANGQIVGNGTPWTWAAGDQLQFDLTYEAA